MPQFLKDLPKQDIGPVHLFKLFRQFHDRYYLDTIWILPNTSKKFQLKKILDLKFELLYLFKQKTTFYYFKIKSPLASIRVILKYKGARVEIFWQSINFDINNPILNSFKNQIIQATRGGPNISAYTRIGFYLRPASI